MPKHDTFFKWWRNRAGNVSRSRDGFFANETDLKLAHQSVIRAERNCAIAKVKAHLAALSIRDKFK